MKQYPALVECLYNERQGEVEECSDEERRKGHPKCVILGWVLTSGLGKNSVKDIVEQVESLSIDCMLSFLNFVYYVVILKSPFQIHIAGNDIAIYF